MGQNESKGPPRGKMNQQNANFDISSVGGGPSSSEVSGASSSYIKVVRAELDLSKNQNETPSDKNELSSDRSKSNFHGQGEHKLSSLNKTVDTTNRLQTSKSENRSSPFIASQVQGQKLMKGLAQVDYQTTNDSQGLKSEKEDVLSVKSQPKKHIYDEKPLTMSQPKEPKYINNQNGNRPTAFPASQTQVQRLEDLPIIFASNQQPRSNSASAHDKLTLSQPEIQKEVSRPIKCNINQSPNVESNATKRAMESKPLQKIISSGNPFFKSPTNGMLAKASFEVNVNNQPSVTRPSVNNLNCDLSQIKDSKDSSGNNLLLPPQLGPTNVSLCTTQDNLADGCINSKISSLRLTGAKGSNKDDNTEKILKQVEMLAESLTNSGDKNQLQKVSIRKEIGYSQDSVKHSNCTLQDCILKMKNISDTDQDSVISLQKEIVTNLKQMEMFTLLLRTMLSSPVLNSEIYSVCESVKENLSLLGMHFETFKTRGENIDVRSISKEKCMKKCGNQNPVHSLKDNQNKADSPDDHNKAVASTDMSFFETSDTNMDNEENVIETDEPMTNITPLSSFMVLIDNLPDDLIEDKKHISLRNTELFCRICERPIAFHQVNLIEHLRGKNHCAKKKLSYASGKEMSHHPYPSDSSLHFKPSSLSELNACPAVQKNDPVVYNLPPNYRGVLDLINKSVEEDFNLGVDVFICVLCDFLENDKNKALDHMRTLHVDLPNVVWHLCKTCPINIFGTEVDFKEHYLTMQHINIAKLRNGSCAEEFSYEKCSLDATSATEEFDRGSVCSFKSDVSNKSRSRLSPYEILLSIAKDKHDNSIKGPHGLYCQVCNRYTLCSESTTNHFETEMHKKSRMKNKFKKKPCFRSCLTCEVQLFVDADIWREHQNLPVHKELSASKSIEKYESSNIDEGCLDERKPEEVSCYEPPRTCRVESSSPESSCPEGPEIDLSALLSSLNESGPHYDMMKRVLKKHTEKKPDNVFYGFYCHLCQLYFVDQEQWKDHLNTSSHGIRINSSECVGRRVLHDCAVCNIRLICDEKFFLLHMQSLAHNAISRIPGRKQTVEEPEVEEDYSEDEDNSSEDSDECKGKEGANTEEVTKVNSNNFNNPKGNTNKPLVHVPNGIHFSGLPKDCEPKVVSDYFKNFGPLKSCKVDRNTCSGSAVFRKMIAATILLQKKTVYINNAPVNIKPLIAAKSRYVPPGERVRYCMPPEVVEVLNSKSRIAAAVSGLLDEMGRNYGINQQKGNEIRRDLSAVVPGSKVLFFGSQVTGLATGRSDFDIYIDFDGKKFYTDLDFEQQQRIIQHLEYQFTQRGSKFVVEETILEARVPIIRVVHMKTNTLCDISCRSGLSVENSHLVRLYLEYDPRVRWLVVAIRFWMEANELLDRNAFTSYATVWLVLFFLMRVAPHPVVCPVTTLQKDCLPNNVARWDCRFHRDMKDVYRCFRTFNRQSELELLTAFFHMYATCPLKAVVLCPLNGCVLTQNHFENVRLLPREFAPYVDKIYYSSGAERLRINTPICLQDPFDLSHNITKGVSRTDLKKFKAFCKQSHIKCKSLLTR